jgi:Tfp pilus assembly protein PilF
MKKHIIFFRQVSTIIIGLILLFSCKEMNDRQNTLDMITARTMGLAYLEEDKLPEAETTFKQLTLIAPQEAIGYANLGLVYIRMGRYNDAEENLIRALEHAPVDPEIQLNLADVLLMTDRKDQAIALLELTLRDHPEHIRTLYKLGQLYAVSKDENLQLRGEQFLIRVVDFLPANIVARFDLIDLLIRHQKTDLAVSYLEEVQKQMPEFPDEAHTFYDQCLVKMKDANAREALAPFNIFRNILKPSPLYRFGYDELKGAGGPLIGTPIISFRQDITLSGITESTVMKAIRFTDATASSGLNVLPVLVDSVAGAKGGGYILALADFDGNGTQDVYASGTDEKLNRNVRFLLQNNFGKFINISGESGIDHQGKDRFALFTDYDNDGYLDLYIVNSIKNILYYHYQPKKFRDVTKGTGIAGKGSGLAACFADFDHDGDLDLYQANQDMNQFCRNNLDGTFTENAQKMNIAGEDTPSIDMAYADFDDDGDLDIFVLNAGFSNALYSNLRQGQFADITKESGLFSNDGSAAMSIGDYNNDGLQDLIVLPATGELFYLFKNSDDERFIPDKRSEQMTSVLQNYISKDVRFFDFDNDGHLDLVISVEPKQYSKNLRGLLLFHNNGKGVFSDATSLLPESLPYCGKIYLSDYNEDGDLDIFLCGNDGRIHLLRNDGGNANNYLKVQLVGLRTGSGKNNYFGLGAKLEVRSGDLYQSRTVTETVSHFGLGQRTKADVVRVLWTNGIPQNLFEPGSNQALLEKQILKGSCPFLYTWNGKTYEFVTDVLWRSALGMPLGIMGGETAYAFSDPSEDYFKIPGEMLKKKDNTYSLQLTSELWETAYFDQVKLLVVAHPDTSDIYIDERFTPPPFHPLHFYHVGQKKYPKSIVDDLGNDLLEVTRYKDDVYVSELRPERYQGITRSHDLLIDLGKRSRQEAITLFLNGWVFPTDASINVALSQSSENQVHPPRLQVKDMAGHWQTVINNISFPMGKNKYVILALTDKFLSENHQVRIQSNMQIYWDYIFFTVGEMNIPFRTNTLLPKSADLHYRGFSRMYRKGGRYGPFWFDYNDVSEDPLWRDLEGYYTRYGDVQELLLEADDKYIITNAGDEITIEFDATTVPDLPAGWSCDFIIYTNGWLKDGDLNTARGQTVEPLPFRGMSKYPYGENEHYPADEDHQQFLNHYITREVTTDRFKRMVLDE